MQKVKYIQLLIAILILIGVVSRLSFKLGELRRSRADLAVSLPYNVKIHEYISSGQSNKASTLAAMNLMGKIKRLEELTNNFIYKLSDNQSLNSPGFKADVERAMAIINKEKIKILQVNPTTP